MAEFGRAKEKLLRRFLVLDHGVPSHDTFTRVFRFLDPKAFEAAFRAFTAAIVEAAGMTVTGVVAIDKALRRAYERGAAHMPKAMVTAWAAETRLSIGCMEVKGGAEADAALQLIGLLSLGGCVVTADALHCHRAMAEAITARGGDYALALKGNQPGLLKDAQAAIERGLGASSAKTACSAHGRKECREAIVVKAPGMSVLHEFPGLQAVARVTSWRKEEPSDRRLGSARARSGVRGAEGTSFAGARCLLATPVAMAQELPMSPAARLLAAAALTALLPACSGAQEQPAAAVVGPDPELPEPERSLLPTVNVAEATGWSEGEKPVAAEGLEVAAFAEDLEHPRWLYVLPNGDVLVAETNAQPQDGGGGGGLRALFMERAMKKAGAAAPSPDRITLLRDADGDGVAETREIFLDDLTSPFGMALIDDRLYVANTDGVVSFPYREGQTRIDAEPIPLTDLPANPPNYHWTKNILASEDGETLYATVGSNSNVAENGMEAEEGRAAIWAIDVETGEKRLFATGLRNPNGLAWNPWTGELWTAVNERDELGDDLVPDYITSVQEGGFYGWPYSYFGRHVDDRVEPQRPDLVEEAIVPDYAVGAHVAAIGLAFSEGAELGPRFAEGAFVGLHGSWNRDPRSGYEVIFVPFRNGEPDGLPLAVLTGFLDGDEARGRPVGVAIAADGALLVADDVGNTVWRVTASDQARAADAGPRR